MKEASFIHLRQDEWRALEREMLIKDPASTTATMKLYDRVADDLSYAQAHYPDSKLLPYLNELNVRAHIYLHGGSAPVSRSGLQHWFSEVVIVMRMQRGAMLTSLAVFLFAIGLGWMSSWIDPDFCRVILGDFYVDMTLDNIEKGDPMAVYSSTGRTSMFLGIGVNNIRVAMLAFALGMLTSLGTIMVLFSNGVMVGAFFYLFYNKSLAALAWTTIMIHGTLELSAIVIAGAAGICIGNAILYPGTYSRLTSLRRSAKDAVHILLSLIPIFALAALLEAYVTRAYMELGMVGRVIIILLSLLLLYYYYFYIPPGLKSNQRATLQEQGLR